mgnify:CR=1 FL=1
MNSFIFQTNLLTFCTTSITVCLHLSHLCLFTCYHRLNLKYTTFSRAHRATSIRPFEKLAYIIHHKLRRLTTPHTNTSLPPISQTVSVQMCKQPSYICLARYLNCKNQSKPSSWGFGVLGTMLGGFKIEFSFSNQWNSNYSELHNRLLVLARLCF